MSHDNHTTDCQIREIDMDGNTLEGLRKMAKGWKDPFPLPTIEEVPASPGSSNDKRVFRVVRDDIAEVGSKGRFGSLLFQRMEHDTLVYVAPRVGWAPISLAKLAKIYGKRLILFAPASKTPSRHQQVAMELGAEMRFYRIAAMPNLQQKAEEFADKHGYMFAPLGLRHPLVTAAIIATCDKLTKKMGGQPDEVWSAISTGVLSRGLQLGWQEATFRGVAVARNIKRGERGMARLYSHPFAFTRDELDEFRPPFPSASNYDAKVWRFMQQDASDGALMWNVAGEIDPIKPLPKNWNRSDVAWGDDSAFRRK